MKQKYQSDGSNSNDRQHKETAGETEAAATDTEPSVGRPLVAGGTAESRYSTSSSRTAQQLQRIFRTTRNNGNKVATFRRRR